jgi:hypothetical protein
MEAEGWLRVADILVGILDLRQAKNGEHDLVELLVIAVCGVLASADDAGLLRSIPSQLITLR